MESALPTQAVRQGGFFGAAKPFAVSFVEQMMMGGASILALIFCVSISAFRFNMLDDVRAFLQFCAESTVVFATIFSYPHFMWSYRFAYGQGHQFIAKHWWELIVFPLGIVALCAFSAVTWKTPVNQVPFLLSLESLVAPSGIMLGLSEYKSLGNLTFASLFLAQFIMSGYHYGMQAFGASMHFAEKRGFCFSKDQRAALKYYLYALWAMNLFSGYTFLSIINGRYFGIHPVRFPEWIQVSSWVFYLVALLFLSRRVLAPMLKEHGKLPPVIVCMPILAVTVWLQPFFQPYGFQLWIVPLAHGLQYLYFSLVAESGGFDPHLDKINRTAYLKTVLYVCFFAFMCLAGYAAFRGLPLFLDNSHALTTVSPNFFFVAAYMFLSVHHYVIDGVAWRPDSRAKQVICRSAREERCQPL